MPQSLKVHAVETTDIPEHRAQTAVAHEKTANPTAHEQTINAEDHFQNTPHISNLVHGKAASLQAAAQKKSSKVSATNKLKAAATNKSNHMIAFGAGALALGIFHLSRSR